MSATDVEDKRKPGTEKPPRRGNRSPAVEVGTHDSHPVPGTDQEVCVGMVYGTRCTENRNNNL